MSPLVAVLEHDPARIFKTVGAATLLVGAAVAITLAATPWRKQAADACGGGVARMAEVWHGGKRAEIEGAFDRSKLPYAAAAFAATAGSLDRYAAAWAAGHRDSCEATHVRRDQSPAMLDLRTRCLQQRRAALASTLDILAKGETNTVQMAGRIVDSLPAIDGCADLAALSGPTPPPDDPAVRAKIDGIAAQLATPVPLAISGHPDRALELAERLVVEARAVGHRPLLAEALYTHGLIEGLLGHKPRAAEIFYEALTEGQASSTDSVVALVSIRLTTMSIPDFAKSRQWEKLADATVTRMGSPPRMVADKEDAQGVLATEEGRYAEGVTHLEAAVAASVRAGDEGELRHAGVLSDLGHALGAAGRPEEAIARSKEAMAIYRRIEGDTHPSVARMLNNISSMESDLGRWQAALEHSEQSYAIMVALGLDKTGKGAIRLRGQAMPLMHLGRLDEALERNGRALALMREIAVEGDDTLGGFLQDRGRLLETAGRYDEARAMYQEAFDIYTKKRGAGHPYTNTLHVDLVRIGLMQGLARARVLPAGRIK